MIKVVSFNIDDKLLDKISFEERFYYEEIPKLVSVQHKVGLEKAKEFVRKQYRTISVMDPDFFRPAVWFEKFKIKPDWKEIVEDMVYQIQIHREAPEAIMKLHKAHTVVLVTKHPKEFLRAKLNARGLVGEFNAIFSAVDDLNIAKKDQRLYESIGKIYKCAPSEILHIGDVEELDHKIPQGMGIHTLLLDRSGLKNGMHVIRSLKDVQKHIDAINKEDSLPKDKKQPKIVYLPKEPKRLFEF